MGVRASLFSANYLALRCISPNERGLQLLTSLASELAQPTSNPPGPCRHSYPADEKPPITPKKFGKNRENLTGWHLCATQSSLAEQFFSLEWLTRTRRADWLTTEGSELLILAPPANQRPRIEYFVFIYFHFRF